MAKRKLEASDRPKSRKRAVSFSEPTGTARVSFQKEVLLPPVLASSPGVAIPQDVPFDLYTRPTGTNPTARPGLRRVADQPSRECDMVMQSSRHPRIDYVGVEESGDNVQTKLNHYIAVYDPVTGSLQITPTHRIAVRASVRANGDDPADARLRSEEQAKATFRQQRDALGNQFGTTKTKKAISARQVNVIASGAAEGQERLASAMLDTVSSAAAAALDRTAIQTQVDNAKPRPQPNMAAASVADVYRPEQLIGGENVRNLSVDDWVEAIRNNQDVSTPSRFVANRLQRLVAAFDDDSSMDGTSPELQLKMLRYLLFLIELFLAIGIRPGADRKPKKWPRKEEFERMHPGSVELSKRARKIFSENNDVTRWHADYLVTHMAAISMTIDQFETDTYDLRDDLGLENVKMSSYFREIGARVVEPAEGRYGTKKEASLHRIAKLKLPLSFPQQRAIVNKRR